MPELNQLVRADCIKYLNNQPEGWVDLVFADPPFNIGYRYHGYEDRKDVDEYVNWSEKWMRAVYRALKPTGSFYLAIGDEFAADLCYVARRKIGFTMRNWIIWHYTFGQQTKKKFALSHTHILYFTKEKPDPGMTNLKFNADAVRVASARQTTYADVRANPKGKLPDDTWYLRPQETGEEFFAADSDTWYVSRLCGTFGEREGWHGCQMPFGVLNRIIRASSNPGDVVLDPFNGSGTTVVSAALLDRQYVGIDQSKKYVAFANKRLTHYLKVREGLLKTSKDSSITPEMVIKTAADVSRASRVETETDSLGRARVPRGKYRRRRPTADGNGARVAVTIPSPSSAQTSDLAPAPVS